MAVELELFAIPKLVGLVGGSPQALADLVKSFDPTTIEDPRERRQAEVVQVFSGTVNLSEVLAELGLS